ncbi:GGDEF domain-containing protein [Marinospirillum alkaliphilum]|uniref:diguanylate cyclase n=1 Tax=Marinospirillum alkaliphilum DSM 21637 TaxID=1122209 RepID=A0A1K1VZG6_9GAMM|nr:diguanylate cyclase [Marinospirillum alkaliphilum]SFX30060.1 diguanylate cyclase (GGDEF) domain-containing protein [Marinospirillum alkaliphilum DSM 21637]
MKTAQQSASFKKALRQRTALVWMLCFGFITIILFTSTTQLAISYRTALATATERATSKSFLIAEWVEKSFELTRFVLQETARGFDAQELIYPTTNPEQHAQQTAWIIERVQRAPNFVFLGMLDRDCVVTHTTIGINLGFDALAHQREYCTLAQKEPLTGLKVSNMFTSVDHTQNVTVSYPLTDATGALDGFALAGLDLSFFQQWLDLIELEPHNVITLYDLNSRLLARKPFIAQNIGMQIEEEHLNRMAKNPSEEHYSHRLISPVDGIERIWSLRRIGDLPFIVVVGEQTSAAIATWRQMLFLYLIAATSLCLSLIFGAREYIRNFQQAMEMHLLATTDPLTSLSNRRCFSDSANRMLSHYNTLAHHKTQNQPPVLIMLDIDHFKQINDCYGHDIGDQVLIDISRVIKSKCGKHHLSARWGGEEFVLLLPNTDLNTAIEFANQLSQQISKLKSAPERTITASLGITTYRAKESLESLMKRADVALYNAKERGRNRIEVA